MESAFTAPIPLERLWEWSEIKNASRAQTYRTLQPCSCSVQCHFTLKTPAQQWWRTLCQCCSSTYDKTVRKAAQKELELSCPPDAHWN